MLNYRRDHHSRSILIAAVVASFSAPALAVTTIWNGAAPNNNTNWGSGANWVGGVAPASTNDVQFGASFTSGTNIQIVVPRTVNSLDINTLTAFSISGAPTDTITITTGTLTRDDPDGIEGNHTINVGINLGASGIWSVWGSGTLAINGPINGVGKSLTKYGWGNLLLTNGSGNYSGGTFIEESTVQMTGTWNGTGAINVASGATLDVNNATISNPINLRGAGFENWGAMRALSASTISGAVTLLENSTIAVNSGPLTISGAIGDGANSWVLTKYGPGELRLNGVNTYKGGTSVAEGTLTVAADTALGSGAVSITAGKLIYSANTSATRDFVITNGRLQANSGVSIALSGSEIAGGFIAGPGTFSTSNVSIMGSTTLAGSNLAATGATNLVNFTNGGSITSSAALSWDGGMNLSSGSVTLNSATLTTTAFSNDGVININNGASLTNSGNNLVSGGGSRITINPGGSLNVSGNLLDLNGALLVNNGTISGLTNVNFGSVAKGSGVYGAVNVTDGGKFSPGNSPGTVTTGSSTWNSGGSYLVEIGNSEHDRWLIDGQLNVAASREHPFTISLASIDGLIFDDTRDYSWDILHAAGGIDAVDFAALSLDTSGFKNPFAGQFFIQSTTNDVVLHYSPVPEPASVVVLALLAFARRRRRNL